jgi:lipopolysaccharide transport system permease protein
VVFAVLFGVICKLPSVVPYFVLTYVGMLGWNLFSGVLSRSSTCLTGNAHLISKVFFPRLVLPLSTVGSNLVDFAVAGAILPILMHFYGVGPGWGLLMIPVWTIMILMLSLGVGLFAAALTVSYRDVQYVLPVMINILQYASPVAYTAAVASARLPGAWRWLYFYNPLAGVFEAFRWSVFNATFPEVVFPPMWTVIYSAIFSAAVLWLGAAAFKQMERKFADVI